MDYLHRVLFVVESIQPGLCAITNHGIPFPLLLILSQQLPVVLGDQYDLSAQGFATSLLPVVLITEAPKIKNTTNVLRYYLYR